MLRAALVLGSLSRSHTISGAGQLDPVLVKAARSLGTSSSRRCALAEARDLPYRSDVVEEVLVGNALRLLERIGALPEGA